MPFIKVDFDDATEQEIVEEGEYQLQVVRADDGESKKGNEMTTVYIKVMDPPPSTPNPAMIRHWLTYPSGAADEDPASRNMRLLDIKRFMVCFNIPYDNKGFDSDNLVGAIGKCLVVQETSKEDGNTYNRLRLPRLKKAGDGGHGESNTRRRR